MFRLSIPAFAVRGFHTSAVSNVNKQTLKRVRAGRYKVTNKQNLELSYEQAKPPEAIAVDKAWNSWNTSNLHEEGRRSETLVEDTFIRKFVTGTWHDCFQSEIIIKRRHNMIVIAGLVWPYSVSVSKMYFLIGYTEELLACLLKCPVKMEIQTVKSEKDMLFKLI